MGRASRRRIHAHSGPTCDTSNRAWTTSANWDYREYDGGRYWIRNNIWGESFQGAGSQTLWANSPSCWGVEAKHSNGDGMVKGYPQNVRGWSVGDGFKTTGHGMGMAAGALTKAMVHWTMDAPETGRFMALWDIYFHGTPTPGGEKAQTSLMIFQRVADDGYYAGQVSGLPPAVTVGGLTFRLEVTTASWATGKTLILFVMPQSGNIFGVESATIDLKAIIDHLIGQGHVSATNDYLTSIQTGWEIIDGGTFATTDYWTALQNEPVP